MQQPIVSVIVPCYNAEKFVVEAVRSVLSQTLRELEVIVIDDGSTDASAARVQEIRDDRLHLIRQPNSGVSAARNLGIREAEGPLIAFLDADDLFLPENLARKVEALSQRPDWDLVHSAEIRFDSESGRDLERTRGREGDMLIDLLELRPGVIHSPSSVVVRKTLLQRAGDFDTQLSTSADWEIWTRFARYTHFSYVDEPLVRYRVHPGQMHRNISRMERDMRYAFAKCREAGMFRDTAHFRYCAAKLDLILAASYLKDGADPVRSTRALLRSLSRSPRPLVERLTRRFRSREAPDRERDQSSLR
jgi:glycosyltransferase involved in cell wall biosynthesis